MANNRTPRGPGDRQRINMTEDYEVAYWTKIWSIDRGQPAEAVRKAGPISAAVAKLLGKEP
jgi:hypothetical protein